MLRFFVIFVIQMGAMALLALLSGRRAEFGERALERLGVLAGVISSSAMAAIVALAFMGERLGEVASVIVFLRWQDLGEAAASLVLMIFVAVGGLIFGCAAAIVPEGSPVLLARWRYFQRRFTCLGHLTSQATLQKERLAAVGVSSLGDAWCMAALPQRCSLLWSSTCF